MKVSVIIPTYNGAYRILNTIKALEVQDFRNFETVVVIDGSTDNTQELLHQYQSTLNQLNIISQPNGGRARVRNRGAKEASGDLLIFYDDDMRPEPDSIERHFRLHQNHKKAIIGGNQLEDKQVLKTDVQKYKQTLSQKWTETYIDGVNKLTQDNIFITAANLSIKKTDFLQLSGFNEKLTDAEDFELAVRAYEGGFNLYFDKSNIAWHDDFITCRSYINRQRQYAKANEMLKVYIPEQYLRKPISLESMIWYKRVIFTLFGRAIFVDLIDKGLLKWLPKKIRYKMYDWTISGLGRISNNKSL